MGFWFPILCLPAAAAQQTEVSGLSSLSAVSENGLVLLTRADSRLHGCMGRRLDKVVIAFLCQGHMEQHSLYKHYLEENIVGDLPNIRPVSHSVRGGQPLILTSLADDMTTLTLKS
jgi:hypothetical protein